jgi:hypothetical protein
MVRWTNGMGQNVPPELVIAITVGGLGVFLFGWAMCGNFHRRSLALQLDADLAMAHRDVAINSFSPPTVIVQETTTPAASEVVAPRQLRPPTPPAPKSIPAPQPPERLAA